MSSYRHSFVDGQHCGPYRFWYHYHEIKPGEAGTTMIDTVHYEMPYGMLGTLIHELAVKRMLRDIFDYRSRKLAALFGEAENGATGELAP